MTDPKELPSDVSNLRGRAEERAKAQAIPAEELSPAQAARLIHELQVHQIELELQNEELRLSQARLAESRDKYADLYDFAPVGYLTLDERGQIVEANLTAATLLGVERSRLLGHFFPLFLVEADRRVFRQLLNNSFSRQERRGEFHLQDGKGDVRTMLLDILFLQDPEGRERRRLALTEITELKRTQEELRLHKEDLEELVAERTAELLQVNEQLREANDSLRTQAKILESMAEGVSVTDKRGNILYANPAFDAMFGYEPGELVGRHSNLLNYYPPEENTKVVKEILESVNTTGAWLGEFRNRRKDGTPFFTAARISALRVGDKKLYISTQNDITERKRAEKALRESEAQLQTIIENVTEGVVVADLEGRLLHWNPAALAMHGIASMEECRRRLPEFADTFELSTVEDGILPLEKWPLARILGGETLRGWEVHLRRPGTDWQRVFSYGGTLARDQDGHSLLAVVTVSDITENKAAEEALRESREDLNRAQAVAQAGSWRLQVRQNRLTWSEENHRIFGIPQGTPLTYETFLSTVHPEDRNYVDRKWTAALKGEPYDIEHRIVVDDAVKWVRERAELEFDAQGLLLGGFGTTQDITGRKRAEEALRRAHDELELRVQERTAELRQTVEQLLWEIEERQQAEEALEHERRRLYDVLETMPAYVALLAPDYTVPYANQEFVRRFGQAEVGERCYEFLFGRQDPCPDCQTYKILETNKPQEWEWLGPDGRVYAIYDYPFTDADGSPLILEMGVDITDRKRAEVALKESEERLHHLAGQLLEVQETERKRLARELHDELGQSLLLLKFKLSSVNAGLSQVKAEVRKDCQEALAYLSDMVNEVRRLSRDLSPSPLEELGLTSSLKYLCSEFCKHYKISSFSINIANIDQLFQTPGQINIYRIFQEILTNIGKHAGATHIVVDVKKQSRAISVTVEDNGRGFSLAEVMARKGPGKGIGLASMQERLRMLGGSFKIRSRPEAGTRITFTVPLKPE